MLEALEWKDHVHTVGSVQGDQPHVLTPGKHQGSLRPLVAGVAVRLQTTHSSVLTHVPHTRHKHTTVSFLLAVITVINHFQSFVILIITITLILSTLSSLYVSIIIMTS